MIVTEHTETLKVISEYDGRIYRVDLDDHSRFFPSVTTVLGYKSDKGWLEEWKKRVGEEEVQRKSKFALSHGTDTHLLIELISSGKHKAHDAVLAFSNHYTRMLYKKSLPCLIRSIDQVDFVETALASLKLGIAGRCDMACVWEGKRSILDIKTASTYKELGTYDDYFVQITLYSEMLKEKNYFVEQGVIFFVLDEGPRPVEVDLSKYKTELYRRVKEFYSERPEILKMSRTKYDLGAKSILT